MLQTSTIEPRTLELLELLMKDKIFNQFSLVGTALALQIGHRVSVDLDLFTTEKFDKNKIIEFFVENFEFSIDNEGEQMLITSINGIKVDFVKMAYPILYPSVVYNSIRILNIKDIALD